MLIAVFTVVVGAWLAAWQLTERAYEKKSFEREQRRIRANIAVSKLAHKKKGEN